jgi:hypothetical protein
VRSTGTSFAKSGKLVRLSTALFLLDSESPMVKSQSPKSPKYKEKVLRNSQKSAKREPLNKALTIKKFFDRA